MLLPEFSGLKRLMFLTMYGAGLRHAEWRRLRVPNTTTLPEFADLVSPGDTRYGKPSGLVPAP